MKRSGASLFGVLLGAGILLSGCSLPLEALDAKTRNTCTSNTECGAHGACVSDGEGAKTCVATEADLGPVILEVRPSSDAKGNTVSHVFAGELSLSGAFPSGARCKDPANPDDPFCVDLAIPQNVTFAGMVAAPVTIPACTGEDGSVPAKVELHSVSPYSNLSSVYKTDAVATTDSQGAHGFRYSLEVPAGIYDVYLAPTPLASECDAASLPPRLISAVPITSNTEFKPDSTAPLALQGSVIVPDATNVDGWKVEVVDPDYGLVISDSGTLGKPAAGTGDSALLHCKGLPMAAQCQLVTGLRYFYKKSAVIRLRAPDGKLVVHWSLDPLDPTMVKLSLADLVANTQSVEANVVDGGVPPNPVAASVRIRSLKLTGSANQNATFRVDTETDLDGKIHADLVEGTYRVSISPKVTDGTSATLVADWEVKGTLGFGKTFVLPERPKLRGRVASPAGSPLAQLSVLASPVIDAQTYVTSAFDVGDVVPRVSSTQTNDVGAFDMLVDPGTLDFSIQPSADTRFSWLVIPRLLVNDASQGTGADLSTLSLPAPALVSGQVSSAQGVVPSAVVRAWLPILNANKGTSGTTALIQIGETVSDEKGRYVLPLPASISFATPKP